ncbi:MAG: hypothetical protein ABSE49_00510 [Polyangiaceae bacterium]
MKWLRASLLLLVMSLVLAMAWSCGTSNPGGGGFGPTTGSDGSTASSGGGDSSIITNGGDGSFQSFGDGPPPQESGGGGGCTNLQCQVHQCGGSADGGDGGGTTLSGTVFDPAGRNPLYNVAVYIPNSPAGKLDAIPIGIGANSCSCSALFSGQPIVYATTDTSGNFTLYNVPDGDMIPLVVQIGKWRKEITVPTIKQCQPNSAGNISLPKNLTDGMYASLPNIAVSTGGLDTLECLLTRVGVDEAFFTGQTAGPGVHIFQGFGGNAAAGSETSPAHLWDSLGDLKQYDIIMLSCEGEPTVGVSATTATYLGPYVDQGGRVFAEHYHYAFFTNDNSLTGTAYPEFTNVASWTNLGAFGNDSPYNSDITGVIESTLPNGMNFPEGKDLKAWLGTVKALNTNGEIVVPSANARDTATISATNLATPWVVTDPSISPPSAQYFSWDQPFDAGLSDAGVPQYCGRVVYSDMHVSGSAADYENGNTTVPTGCDSTAALTADEDAIEFILFDLSSCITPVGFTPQPPQPEGGIAQ